MASSSQRPQTPSVFVTIVAWVAIAISALGVAVYLLHTLLYWLVYSTGELHLPSYGGVAAWIFSNGAVVFPALLAFFGTALTAAIGLLRRREWARTAFAIILGLAALGLLASLPLVLDQILSPPLPTKVPDAFALAWSVALAVGMVFLIAIGALLVWTAAKLRSTAVAMEFQTFSHRKALASLNRVYSPPPLNETDTRHLNLLATCHIVLALLIAVFGCLPLIHVALGVGVLTESFPGPGSGPPRVAGWMFALIGGFFFLLLQGLAVATFYSGTQLRRRRRHMLSQVVAALLCLGAPLGTLLGVLTILVLQRPSVRALYEHSARPTT